MDPQKKASLRQLRARDRVLDLQHPRIMGVLNITPDSFSDGGRLYRDAAVRLAEVLDCARHMVDEGAAVIDVGGESTRPGAEPVTLQEELQRVIPVVEALTELDIMISVDTRHAAVAAAALDAGAHLINDIGAGADAGMFEVVARHRAGYALMHMQGSPQTMQQSPRYNDVVREVRDYLSSRVQSCLQAGCALQTLLIDPGFGFGKRVEHNLQMLAQLEHLRVHDLPLLVGLSRKSTIGAVTGREVGERVYGSVAAALIAAQRGADLIRVHDVAATADVLRVWQAVQAQASAVD